MITRFLRLRRWNIVSKMVGVNLLILLISFSYLLFFVIPRYENSIVEEHKNFTVSMVDIALSILNRQHQLELKGEVTKEVAQKRALETIYQINNQNGYFWIHTLDLVMITHPINRSLEGETLSDYKDPDGFKLFVAMNELIKSKGGGFVEYKWQKPSDSSIQSKMSYVKAFEPWGWVIGSGIYLDDLKREISTIREEVAILAAALLFCIIIFSFYAAKRVNQPLRTALEITRGIAKKPELLPDHEILTSSEPQLLLNAIETMVHDLKEAKDAAENSNRAKSMFLAKMSHEIRTPMNAVIGMTELALESSVSPEQKEYLEGVRSSGEHLMHLINDILDISKIEAGRLQLESIPFSLRNLISNSMKPLEYRAKEKGLYCKVRVAETVPDSLLGDPLRFRQILTNLTGNAIKFTSNGGITLRIDLDELLDKKVRLAVSMSDTGIGISENEIGEIFKPFAQADVAVARHYGGTGLGLSIVSQIVDMMGGTIAVASEIGKGSTFCLMLTFPYSVEEPQFESSQKLEKSEAEPALKSLRILVAEDVKLNQILILKLLEKFGHSVTVVSNGLEAVEKWRSENFDLILMDVLMPIMGGVEATQLIRKDCVPGKNGIPIIALTAQIMGSEVDDLYSVGMNGYLSKPLSQQALLEALAPYTKNTSETV